MSSPSALSTGQDSATLVTSTSPQQHEHRQQKQQQSGGGTRFRRIKNIWNHHSTKRQHQKQRGLPVEAQKENRLNEADAAAATTIAALSSRPSTAITKIPKLRDRREERRTTASRNTRSSSRDDGDDDDDDFYYDDDLNLADLSLSSSSSSSSLYDDYEKEYPTVPSGSGITKTAAVVSKTKESSFEEEFLKTCQEMTSNQEKELKQSECRDAERCIVEETESDTSSCSIHDNVVNKETNDTKYIDNEDAMDEVKRLKGTLQDIKERYFMYRALQDTCIEEQKVQIEQLNKMIENVA